MAGKISILINKKNNEGACIIEEDGEDSRCGSMENTTIQQQTPKDKVIKNYPKQHHLQ